MKIRKKFLTLCLEYVNERAVSVCNIKPNINHKNWEPFSLFIHKLRKQAHMVHADVSQIEMCTLYIHTLESFDYKILRRSPLEVLERHWRKRDVSKINFNDDVKNAQPTDFLVEPQPPSLFLTALTC